MLAWTLVLKVLRPPLCEPYPTGLVGPVRPDFWGYWAAEPLAYASGHLADLPGISAPRFYGVVERPDGDVWLWLEEVREDDGRPWSLGRYGLAARHFGRFNGAYLTGRPIPTDRWFSRGRCGPREPTSSPFHQPATFIDRNET